MNIPDDLQYTAEHEWLKRLDDGTIRLGITDYAQDQLGDIVYVDLPEVGSTVDEGAVVAEVESTKSVGEVYAPVSGTVTATNESVADQPELVNQDPYGNGWLLELAPASEPVDLLNAEQYRALVE
jgi:glycine cleavage system H protein